MQGERLDLDFACRHVRIYGRPVPDAAADADDIFVSDFFGLFHQLGLVGLEYDLGQPLAVADIDKDQMPHIAGFLDPPAEDDVLPFMGGPQVAGVMGPFPNFGGGFCAHRCLSLRKMPSLF